jgi:hypothetical protein
MGDACRHQRNGRGLTIDNTSASPDPGLLVLIHHYRHELRRLSSASHSRTGAEAISDSGRHQPDQIPSASPVSDPTTPSIMSCSRS